MDETDLALLDRAGGLAAARVVVLPTAAGLEEPSSPQQWLQRGLDHFTRLGVRVDGVPILTRADAHDPQWLAVLEAATLIYFSGGSPQYLVEVLSGTPAWAAIAARHAQGAALAGCSAGAMALGGQTARPGALRAEGGVEWQGALGLLPRVIVLPHFDRLATYIGAEALDRAVRSVPAGMVLLAIDEQTALVRLDPAPLAGSSAWRVMGRRTVSRFLPTGEHDVFGTGETLLLDTGQQPTP
jgi:cyanophycinase-like exopeptidase